MDDWKLKTMPVIRLERLSETFVWFGFIVKDLIKCAALANSATLCGVKMNILCGCCGWLSDV